MAFLGLGNFGEGFVTGFAESANEALKKDIDRINTRIDRVAIAKADRAVKDQDKRRKEKDKITDALKAGAAIYGDADSQDAIAFAAGILKEEGNLQAYESFMSELRERKSNEPNFGAKLRSLVNRPEGSDAREILTFDNIADGFLGTKYQTNLNVEGAVSLDDTLVGKFFGGKNLNQQVEKQITSEITSRGLVIDQSTGVELPENYFDRDAYIIYKMSPKQRVAHYQGVLNDPSVTDETPEGKEVRQDAAKKVAENQAIVDKMELENADASGRIAIFTSRYQIERKKSLDIDLTSQERVKAGNLAKKYLKEIAIYDTGQTILKNEFGTIDERLAEYRKEYVKASDVVMPGQTSSRKAQLREDIEKLEADKRELASFGGTMSEKTAYAIDEAIRNGDSAGLEKALKAARNIDAVKEGTKNIKAAEHAAANTAITNIALTKLKLNPKFGVGVFTSLPSGEIEFVGPDNIKEEAAAELKKIISEVTNDAIAVSRTERDKKIFTETARILGVKITQGTTTPGSAADQTSQMLGENNTSSSAEIPVDTGANNTLGVTTSADTPASLSSDNTLSEQQRVKSEFMPDGATTDVTTNKFIQTMLQSTNSEGNPDIPDDEEIIATAKNIDPVLADAVTAQLSNFYKAKYDTASDYGDFLATQYDPISTGNRQKIYTKLQTVYGANEAEATAIVVKLQTQAEAAEAEAEENEPETLAERLKRLENEKIAKETYGKFGGGVYDRTNVTTAIGG